MLVVQEKLSRELKAFPVSHSPLVSVAPGPPTSDVVVLRLVTT